MEIQIWIVNTCIPEEGEKPCIPSPFGTEAEAEAYADEMMRGEWESSGVEDDDGEPVEYPGDWRAAQERLVEWNGPGWGTWEITAHRVTIAQGADHPRNCSTCKHWNRDEQGFPYVTGLELHPCTRIPHGDDVTEFRHDDYTQEYLKQEFAGTLAFANDASGYSAHLATAAGFSCAHWERVEQ